MSLQSKGTNYENDNGHNHQLGWLGNISKKNNLTHMILFHIVLTLIISTHLIFVMTIPRYRYI